MPLFFIIPSITSAQAIDSFSISASPEYPKEFTQTTITINSFSADLNRAKITWRENGVVVAQEIGLKQKNFSAPKNGQSKTIGVEIQTITGYRLVQNYTLSPQAVDILWEAPDSYVPPFYKGKALAGEQGIVRVVAIPNFTKGGVPLDRSASVYNWTRNDTSPDGASGYGKAGFVFRFNPLKNSETIKVLVGTLSGDSQVAETITLSPTAPRILLYETNPLLGNITGLAFSRGLRLITDEITLVAEPYYVSGADDIRSSSRFSWSVGGSPAKTGNDSTRLTLKKPGVAGQTNIGVTVSHLTKTLQSARGIIPIVYDK